MKNDDTALNEQVEAVNDPTTAPVANKEASEEVDGQDTVSADTGEAQPTETG